MTLVRLIEQDTCIRCDRPPAGRYPVCHHHLELYLVAMRERDKFRAWQSRRRAMAQEVGA